MRRTNRLIAIVTLTLAVPAAAPADVVLDWNAIMMTTVG